MLCILNVGTVPMLYILYVGTVPTLCILDVGTVPMLCILNVETVPTFSSSQKNSHLNLIFQISEQIDGKYIFKALISKKCPKFLPKISGNYFPGSWLFACLDVRSNSCSNLASWGHNPPYLVRQKQQPQKWKFNGPPPPKQSPPPQHNKKLRDI